MAETTKLDSLKINLLTNEQYKTAKEAGEIDLNQLYMITDEVEDATTVTIKTWSSADMPLTMTVNNNTYYFVDGMTWGEWVESEYNTGGWMVSDSNSRVYIENDDSSTTYINTQDFSYVTADDVIIVGYDYWTTTETPIITV